eukprot:TRINITY_DN68087_c0_g1_i1.p1 TRINITY_DN68087_c0_g1~~TRINITY_DN68087_c0_g1_i1.p1  ORF type:complete len:1113 (+),score=262.83 TRINITY_DN68087_c0_g1_i1:242-3580(+)
MATGQHWEGEDRYPRGSPTLNGGAGTDGIIGGGGLGRGGVGDEAVGSTSSSEFPARRQHSGPHLQRPPSGLPLQPPSPAAAQASEPEARSPRSPGTTSNVGRVPTQSYRGGTGYEALQSARKKIGAMLRVQSEGLSRKRMPVAPNGGQQLLETNNKQAWDFLGTRVRARGSPGSPLSHGGSSSPAHSMSAKSEYWSPNGPVSQDSPDLLPGSGALRFDQMQANGLFVDGCLPSIIVDGLEPEEIVDKEILEAQRSATRALRRAQRKKFFAELEIERLAPPPPIPKAAMSSPGVRFEDSPRNPTASGSGQAPSSGSNAGAMRRVASMVRPGASSAAAAAAANGNGSPSGGTFGRVRTVKTTLLSPESLRGAAPASVSSEGLRSSISASMQAEFLSAAASADGDHLEILAPDGAQHEAAVASRKSSSFEVHNISSKNEDGIDEDDDGDGRESNCSAFPEEDEAWTTATPHAGGQPDTSASFGLEEPLLEEESPRQERPADGVEEEGPASPPQDFLSSEVVGRLLSRAEALQAAEDPPDGPHEPGYCDSGHLLESSVPPYDWTCDVCYTHKGMCSAWRCEECQYDICDKCYRELLETQRQRREAQATESQAEEGGCASAEQPPDEKEEKEKAAENSTAPEVQAAIAGQDDESCTPTAPVKQVAQAEDCRDTGSPKPAEAAPAQTHTEGQPEAAEGASLTVEQMRQRRNEVLSKIRAAVKVQSTMRTLTVRTRRRTATVASLLAEGAGGSSGSNASPGKAAAQGEAAEAEEEESPPLSPISDAAEHPPLVAVAQEEGTPPAEAQQQQQPEELNDANRRKTSDDDDLPVELAKNLWKKYGPQGRLRHAFLAWKDITWEAWRQDHFRQWEHERLSLLAELEEVTENLVGKPSERKSKVNQALVQHALSGSGTGQDTSLDLSQTAGAVAAPSAERAVDKPTTSSSNDADSLAADEPKIVGKPTLRVKPHRNAADADAATATESLDAGSSKISVDSTVLATDAASSPTLDGLPGSAAIAEGQTAEQPPAALEAEAGQGSGARQKKVSVVAPEAMAARKIQKIWRKRRSKVIDRQLADEASSAMNALALLGQETLNALDRRANASQAEDDESTDTGELHMF